MIYKFFKSEGERNLWIKLNAERIQYMEFIVIERKIDLGDINTPFSPMWISKNQLEYDEKHSNELRITFEQFLTMSNKELFDFNFNNIISESYEKILENL